MDSAPPRALQRMDDMHADGERALRRSLRGAEAEGRRLRRSAGAKPAEVSEPAARAPPPTIATFRVAPLLSGRPQSRWGKPLGKPLGKAVGESRWGAEARKAL
eukprot:SAG25_NODE_821_length_5214_cov_2.405670_1_plen_102_part_10